jgi:molybdopterin molybdotransferase
MIAVAEAERLIHEKLFVPSEKLVPLLDATGHTLAQPVLADRDLPPFDRVAMDGIALWWTDGDAPTTYPIEHVQAAGAPEYTLQSRSACVEVMTGAVLPRGTNTVIPYENLRIERGQATVTGAVRERQHIHARGADVRAGATVLAPGVRIRASEMAVLAAVGQAQVAVYHIAPVAIVATGNELVAVETQPEPHQIRKSNGHALAAALQQLQIESRLYHLADDESVIRTGLASILAAHPIVILSGGVSKGKFDFLPAALASLGVEKQFHQISQKPGKPFWFGRSNQNFVFALPGNPVSTFLCFYRYIRPWLLRSLHQPVESESAILAADVHFPAALTYFLQVKLANKDGIVHAHPVPGGGSGDFVNLLQADGFLELPLGKSEFKKGEFFPLIRYR